MSAAARLIALISETTVYDLGRPMRNGMAQSPNHPPFHHCLDRLHGDRIRADGGSAAADLLTTGCHVGTHVDALAHVSHQGRLHGGVDAAQAQSGGRFAALGIHELSPFAGRGVGSGVPGVGESGERWLADRGAALVGADTLAFECLPAGQGHALLPGHRVMLVERGINIIETMDLDGLATDGVHEFAFVLAHLNIVGATGAPAHPLALA